MNPGAARHIVFLLAGLLLGGTVFAGNPPSEKEVFVFSVPGSGIFLKIGDEEEQRIEFIQGSYVAPRLSGDRSKILLNSRFGGKIGVWIAGEQGSPIAKVVSDFGAAGEGWKMERVCDGDQAMWSPDGNRIVFRRGDAIMERELGAGQERIVAPQGRLPSYLADGRIIFVSAGEKGDRISVSGPRGGTPTELTANGEIKSAPRGSPEGSRIAYQDGAHIRILDLATGKMTQLTTAGGVQGWPVWARDGKSVCYCQSPEFPDGPWDIYWLELENPFSARLVRRKVDMTFDWSGRSPDTDSARELKGRSMGLTQGKEDAVVENDWLQLELSTATGKAYVVPKEGGAKGGRMELAVLDADGNETAGLDAVRVVKNDGEGVVLEAGFRSRDNARLDTVFGIPRHRPTIEVKPSPRAGGVYVRRGMSLVVLPDRLADDLVFDPSRFPSWGAVPAAPVLLGCSPGPAGLAVIVAPGSRQTMTLVNGGAEGAFAGVKVATGGESVFVSILSGGNAWTRAAIRPRTGGKGWEASWSSPFHAQWRLSVAGAGKTGLPPASLAAGTGGNYSRTWNEGVLAELKKPILEFEADLSGEPGLARPAHALRPQRPGPAVVYLQGRSWHTPLDILTPMDIVQDVRGLDGFRDALDLEGIRGYRTSSNRVPFLDIAVEGDKWDIYSLHTAKERDLGILEALGGVRQGNTEGIKSITDHLGGDLFNLLEGLDDRIKEYQDFYAWLEEYCLAKGAAATGFPGSVVPRITAMRSRRATAPVTGVEKVAAAMDAVKASLDAPGNHDILFHSDGYKELHKTALAALAGRQEALAEYRSLAKSLREESGYLISQHPELAGPAGEIREKTGKILRKRYYLEGDWRGEDPEGSPR